MNKIFLHYFAVRLPLHKRQEVKSFIVTIFEKEKVKIERLDYIFCSDNYLLALNKKFLQHNCYTDIITFPLSKSKEGIIGEIYISIERVKDNARILKVAFSEETLRVMFHGALHLCGYNDKTMKQAGNMRLRENFYINLFKKQADIIHPKE